MTNIWHGNWYFNLIFDNNPDRLSSDKDIKMQCSANLPDKFELYPILLYNMNFSIILKKIGEGKLVAIALIWGIIYLMSINISEGSSSAVNEELAHKLLTTGKINGTLINDEDMFWLLSGTWKSNLFTNTKFDHTNPAKFLAKINMVLANGSSPHIHKVSHFTLANISTQGHSTVYEGYLAVSMKLGPVFAIPVIINNYQNETISISLQSLDDITLDQTKVISHFENKPISGIFAK